VSGNNLDVLGKSGIKIKGRSRGITLVSFNEPSKQLKDYVKLTSYIGFINDLTDAGLKVICGYCNTEGVVLASLDIEAITVGAYENTRGFSIDKFLSIFRLGFCTTFFTF